MKYLRWPHDGATLTSLDSVYSSPGRMDRVSKVGTALEVGQTDWKCSPHAESGVRSARHGSTLIP